ncbi:unnamed protein product [Alopecurus aequalis]
MDKTKATPTRAGDRLVAASPTTAPPFAAYRSRSRPAAGRATPFSPTGSRSRRRPDIPALTSLRPDVDYLEKPPNMMKLRIVPEEEWFPHQRHARHLTGNEFWTIVQKDIFISLKNKISDTRWIDWALVKQSTGTDVRRYFAATPGLDRLLERRDFRWADKYIRQFYATLWIHPDRSRIRFMFGDQQRELSRDDFAKCLGLSPSGARVHSLSYPNGNRDDVNLPPPEDIRHLYNNPDAEDHNQLNHETAVVHAIMRVSIRPRFGGRDSLTTLEIWILHFLISAKRIDIVDLMIGEMQEIILNIRQRRLPYAPYLIHLFDEKGWLDHGMKQGLGQQLNQYKALKPDDKRMAKNRARQPVKALKPDGRRRVGSRSLPVPPQAESVFDGDEHAHLDCMLSPSLEERALVVTTPEEDDPHMVPASVPDEFRFSQPGAHDALDCMLSPSLEDRVLVVPTNEEDDPHMVPTPVPDEFRFSQPGAHDAEAGGSGCHADVPPMLQNRADRQTAFLELIHGQLAGLQGQLAEVQGQLTEVRQENRDLQGQLTEVQGQVTELRQENRDVRNLNVVLLSHTLRNSSHHRDILALLDESFRAFRGL